MTSPQRGPNAALALAFCLMLLPSTVAATGERVDVLVQFATPPTPADVAAVDALGGEVTRTFDIVPAVAARIPAAAIDALRRNPRVALVEPDSLVHALEYRPTHDWGIAHIGADRVHGTESGNRGADVTVAILDSGIDCDHVELPMDRCDYGQNIGENFVLDPSHEAPNEADDDYGHGTHVAGTVAAALNGVVGGAVGVAPEATVVALKTLDASGSGAWSRHIAAIDHVWNNGAPLVDIVNMSIGRGDYSATADMAMQRAYDDGILLVAAAGNSGRCSGRGTNLAYPALFDSVVAVAAVDTANARPCWSSTGDKVELTAPGVSVFSTWPENLSSSYRDPQPVCDDGTGDGAADCHYKYGSGTSMSSPHVAGTAALVIASGTVTDANGNGLADEVRARMASTARDLGTAGRDPHFGYGLVDAAAAVGASVQNSPPTASFTSSCSSLSCTFDGSGSSDTDGEITAYSWAFGDGTGATGTTASHTYPGDGSYTVRLTVTDDDGASSTFDDTVTVASGGTVSITLTVDAYKIRGRQYADLEWSGGSSAPMEIWRDGRLIATHPNDGAFTDAIGATGTASYRYVVCDSETGACSNEAVASY